MIDTIHNELQMLGVYYRRNGDAIVFDRKNGGRASAHADVNGVHIMLLNEYSFTVGQLSLRMVSDELLAAVIADVVNSK